MERVEGRTEEIEALRNRWSRLSEASLRINESLDFNAVLQEVLDSARSLTQARYGIITLHDDAGTTADFLSSGMTPEESEKLWTIPGWPRHFEYLSGIPGPLRVSDLLEHIRSVGLPELRPPMEVSKELSFLASPVTHRGERVGSIYLGEKEQGREFTQEDEETLVLFASQAATAIANARRHREERRARADLETLIDTSPVGVVVFDAVTGAVKSLNREALRIVNVLRNPDQSPEQLLEVLTCKRADGREVSLREFPMAELLSTGETVRSEEITMRVPDERSVTVLLNATPILSDEGAVESLVVTLQDMADVQELERLRAEFLAIVSHELRTPLSAIKGSAATALGSAADLDPAIVRQFFRIIEEQADYMHDLVSDLLDVARIEAGTLAVTPEPADVAVLVDRARIAFAGANGRSTVTINVEADLPLVMADRRRIVQVLGNLLTNAARNSSDLSVITVSAVRNGVYVAVSVVDQGRGILAEGLPNLFRKFSRVEADEQGGDTGLGLAICKGIVEAHGGRIWAESDGPGMGARFTFTLPAAEETGSSPATTLCRLSTRSVLEEMGERVRVLAVDDSPSDLRYVRDTLAKSGYEPIVTGEPEEVLPLMAETRPALVLLDLVLPGTDGVELMKDILSVADVPIIFLSAHGRDDLIARVFDMGAADYVVKPFSPTELSARIRAALRRRAAAEPLEPIRPGRPDHRLRRAQGDRGQPPGAFDPEGVRAAVWLSVNAGRVLNYEPAPPGLGPRLRGRPATDAHRHSVAARRPVENPTYLTEPGVYRMPMGRRRAKSLPPPGERRALLTRRLRAQESSLSSPCCH